MRWTARDLRSLAVGLAYLAPALLIFVVFVFIPLGRTFYLSFYSTRSTGLVTSFNGIDHYIDLITSQTFRSSLLATGLFASYAVPIGIALGLVLAVLLNQRLRGISVFRTMMASTIAISAAVGSLIWLLLFNPSLGLLNYVLSLVGVRGPEWLIQPTIAIVAVSITTIWLTLGTNIIVLLAGLQGIPEEIYAAARLDGARRARKVGSYLLLTVVSVLVAFPLLLALSYSFMSEFDIATFPPPVIPAHPSLDNYGKVLATIPIGRYLLNSFIVSTAVVIGQLITASLAAYAFSFLIFRGRQVLFFLFLSTLMIPWEATIIPNYMTIRSLGWLDTYQGLAVPFMATAFGTFLLRQAFMQIPRELWDAARIDGSTTFRFLREIVIPLSRPALGTIAIYGFLSTYNQYFWPLLITNETLMRTTQVGIAQLRFEESLRWGLVMAGVIMVAVPTLALLVLGQRQLIRGLTAGAVKG